MGLTEFTAHADAAGVSLEVELGGGESPAPVRVTAHGAGVVREARRDSQRAVLA